MSFLARSIARHLSRIYGMRILLVQLDSSSAASGQSNGPTFAGWLHGEEAPGAAGGNGVTEMSSGVRDASADAVLFAMGSGRLADLKQDYDMLLFDSAPVAWDSAAVHVASLVDKVVVVAVAEQTRKQLWPTLPQVWCRPGRGAWGYLQSPRSTFPTGFTHAGLVAGPYGKTR